MTPVLAITVAGRPLSFAVAICGGPLNVNLTRAPALTSSIASLSLNCPRLADQPQSGQPIWRNPWLTVPLKTNLQDPNRLPRHPNAARPGPTTRSAGPNPDPDRGRSCRGLPHSHRRGTRNI